MPGVLFEGGSFRPVFSCGVMDALLKEDVMFPYCIGVSAGAADAASYISRQQGRNIRVFEKYRNDKRYIGKKNLLKEKSLFGVQFVFRDIPNKIDPFDMETFHNYEGTFLITTTDAVTGKVRYFSQKDVDEEYNVFCATCALPVILPPAQIGGRKYYDGGLSNPIPIDRLLADGNEKALIVLTRPKGFRKECKRSDRIVAKMIRRKYPIIAKEICTRYKKYNQSVALCEKLEKEGKALIIRPDAPIDSYEKDVKVLRQTYESGYRMAMEHMDQIKAMF